MSFVQTMREKRGQIERVAVCLSGTAEEWGNYHNWWSEIIPKKYRIDVFGHVIGCDQLPSHVNERDFKNISCDKFDASELVVEMSRRKKTIWDKGDIVADYAVSQSAYSLLKAAASKRRYELIENFDYSWCVSGKPSLLDVDKIEIPPVINTVYGKSTTNEFDTEFFYAQSKPFDLAANFFRSLSFIRYEHLAPVFLRGHGDFSEKFSASSCFYFHLQMLHLKLGTI